MKILKLTPAIEKKLLRSRQQRDVEAERVACKIIADVRKRGDNALFEWIKKLDGIDAHREGFWISTQSQSPKRMRRRGAASLPPFPAQTPAAAAQSTISHDFRRAITHAAKNVRAVARQQLPKPWSIDVEPDVRIGQRVYPIESIGCYIPGGRFALVSTLLMTVVPAQVAGVKNITVVCPKPNDALLAAASLLGITRIARVGGAQAIAALAYGTKSVPRVEKIFGPGNRFVTAAKQLVGSDCAIDLPAGPTEAIVLAERGNPRWLAADLLAQAEHAPDAGSFFVTTSSTLARSVQQEVETQLQQLPAENLAALSTRNSGAILLAPSISAACEFVNRFAPEHLSLPENSHALLKQIHSAGTVFLGPWAAQPLGDYASGSNHVLPTGGWARKRGGLSTADFVKCISVQSIGRKGFEKLADTVETLAEAEGLIAHRNAIRIRR
jgi:histidinol dehydrogenase